MVVTHDWKTVRTLNSGGCDAVHFDIDTDMEKHDLVGLVDMK